MAADLGTLQDRPYVQAIGLAILSLLLAGVLVGLGGEVLTGPSLAIVLFLACGSMLAAVVTVSIHLASSRRWGIVFGVAAYLLVGLLYGLLRFAITQERSFLITMSTWMWPWILVWDAGCLLEVWHCLTLGN